MSLTRRPTLAIDVTPGARKWSSIPSGLAPSEDKSFEGEAVVTPASPIRLVQIEHVHEPKSFSVSHSRTRRAVSVPEAGPSTVSFDLRNERQPKRASTTSSLSSSNPIAIPNALASSHASSGWEGRSSAQTVGSSQSWRKSQEARPSVLLNYIQHPDSPSSPTSPSLSSGDDVPGSGDMMLEQGDANGHLFDFDE